MSDYDPLRDRPRNRSTAANGAVVDALLDRSAATAGGAGPTSAGARVRARPTAAASVDGPGPGAGTAREAEIERPGSGHEGDPGRSTARGCLPGALLTAALARWPRERRARSSR